MDRPTLNKVSLVEDDQKLARLIASFPSQHGFGVCQVHRDDTTFVVFLDLKPQVVAPDLMLPGQNGLQVCREIRRVTGLSILILTAQKNDFDHILGLEPDTDGHVIKPTEPPALLARLHVLMRRYAPFPTSPESLASGRLNIGRQRHETKLKGHGMELTTMEFGLLQLLVNQAGEVFFRDEILNRIRGIGFDGPNRSVNVYISKPRNKLKDNPRKPVRIKTAWGKGYPLNPLG